jgi:hypothetical protein
MQRKLTWWDALFLAALLDQSFGKFPHGHHPAGDVVTRATPNASRSANKESVLNLNAKSFLLA